MYKNNPISLKTRMKEIFFDEVTILLYLLFLFCGAMAIYGLFFQGIPKMGELKTQFVSLGTSVIPMVLLFTYLDYSKGGSFGKRKAALYLYYENKSVKSALIRNCVKFLPWELGHISTIHGIYTGFDDFSMALSAAAMLSLVSLLSMALFREDKRHLGDLLAGTQVQMRKENP